MEVEPGKTGLEIMAKRKVETRAPVRIDLSGGWTDVPVYTHDQGGDVVNFSINLYARASLLVDDDGKLSVSYSADVPLGSGFGTTGALNVALLAAIKGAGLTTDEVAEKAFQFEKLLDNTGGRQDQWAAAYGGFQRLIFIGDTVERMPLEPLPSAKSWLKRQLLVVNSGIEHVSGDLHDEFWQRYQDGDADVVAGLQKLRSTTKLVMDGLQSDRRDLMVESFRMTCDALDLMAPHVHAPFKPVVDPLLANKDIAAWKAIGAGGGGCAALLCGHQRREVVEAAVIEAGWTIVEWDYDDEGLTVEES